MKYRVTLNGKVYEVEVAEGEAVLLDTYEANLPTMGTPTPVAPTAPAAPQPAPQNPAAASGAALAAGQVVKSPMPGNILQVKVQVGQKVKAGELLLTLEAMKMENEIVAPQDGSVAQIVVTPGVTVDTGAPLLVLA